MHTCNGTNDLARAQSDSSTDGPMSFSRLDGVPFNVVLLNWWDRQQTLRVSPLVILACTPTHSSICTPATLKPASVSTRTSLDSKRLSEPR